MACCSTTTVGAETPRVPLIRSLWLRLWLCLACIQMGLPAHAAPALSDRPMRAGFGLVVKFDQGQPMAQLDLLPELGVRWVRDAVQWVDMEPRAGEYKPFPPAFSQRLQRYRQQGIGVIYMLGYANGKAYPATKEAPRAPIDPEALGRYAAHVTGLLKAAGVDFAVQVWNEPHNFQILKMVGGAWNGRPPSPWVDHYVDMLRAVSEHVQKKAPGTPVITSEDVLVNHYWFAQHPRLPQGFKGIGLHAYANESSSGPEVVAPYADSEWARPFQLVDRDRAFATAIDRLKRHTRKHTGVEPEVWITEWGFKVDGRFAGGRVTEELVAAFLPRAYVLAEAAGVKVLCWFSMQDANDGAYGLIDRAGRQRPAFRTYVAMSRVVGDLRLTRRLSPGGQQTRGTQAYLFEHGSRRTLMVWSADNGSRTLPLDPAWSATRILDAYGEPVKLDAREDVRQAELGAAPIYIELGAGGTPRWPPRAGD